MRSFGDCAYPLDDFCTHVESIVARLKTGNPPQIQAKRLHLVDLYLAGACDARHDAAWTVLDERFIQPLRPLARRIAANAREADEMLAALPGRLLSHPPSTLKGRTALAAYQGRGPLGAWVRVVLSRLLLDARSRAAPDDLAAEPFLVARASGADPIEPLLDAERATRFARALNRARDLMTPRERVALSFRYAHKLQGKEVARLMRVSPSRVTRLLQKALARCRAAVEQEFENEDLLPARGESLAWDVLLDVLSVEIEHWGRAELLNVPDGNAGGGTS